MSRSAHTLSIIWFITVFLPLIACGPSEEERQEAQRTRDEARRLAILYRVFDEHVLQVSQHCREGLDALRQLLMRDSTLTVQVRGRTEPSFPFLTAVAHATAKHDSTMSCSRLVDSVAKALPRDHPDSGARSTPRSIAGRGFTIPIPTGFTPLNDSVAHRVWDAGGVVLAQPRREAVFRANVVVTPLVSPPNPPDVSDTLGCTKMGVQAALSHHAILETAQIVALPLGRTCQSAIRKHGPRYEVRQIATALDSRGGSMVVCSFDVTDATGPQWCNEIVQGLRFTR